MEGMGDVFKPLPVVRELVKRLYTHHFGMFPALVKCSADLEHFLLQPWWHLKCSWRSCCCCCSELLKSGRPGIKNLVPFCKSRVSGTYLTLCSAITPGKLTAVVSRTYRVLFALGWTCFLLSSVIDCWKSLWTTSRSWSNWMRRFSGGWRSLSISVTARPRNLLTKCKTCKEAIRCDQIKNSDVPEYLNMSDFV